MAEIRVVPRQLSFGVVNVGSTATLQLTVANDGAAALAISVTRIEGAGQRAFCAVVADAGDHRAGADSGV